jgi:hypothetical protein
MSSNIEPVVLLGQSRGKYAEFIETKDDDVLAEAGELLWESLKSHLTRVSNSETSDFKTLTEAAVEMGENFTELFYRCYHFHSWYFGNGVSNDCVVEKQLYLQSVDALEKILTYLTPVPTTET